MRLVALDTTSSRATIALFEDDVLVSMHEAVAEKGQAEALMPLLDGALRSAGWEARSVETWCACAGPGSFTGIRIALATVQGIVLATGARGVSVTAFQAARVAEERAPNEALALVMPGLPGEFYCEIRGEGVRALEPCLLLEADLARTLTETAARRVDVLAVDAEKVGRAFLRVGGSDGLEPLYVAPPRITIPKPKTYGRRP